ncbi:MAG: hypothetical protein Unbinned8699contig1000_25 [Prokaryotic dsDNA virus sp.]|nr:MAG: hypothetical protein Unbinned8699contig1000_25 [Prokaryotic dsDNA virus sp.]|tara:strand:+ start:872 stop:1078 length:207 start_codon:yes stop_codon:yes gene_type:complete
MNLSDNCTACGGQKIVRVILKDGNLIEVLPGSAAPADPQLVFQIETCCSECGLLYSMASLANPIELYR